jgi:hypothetical protein
MNSRERVIHTLVHEEIDRFPRHLWTLPGINMNRNDEYMEVIEKYPPDIIGPDVRYGRGKRCRGKAYEVGQNIDAWGSVWHVAEPGVIGEVKEFPLDDWSRLDTYQLPWELLLEADFSKVNKSCEKTDKFVLAGTEVRPFERMQFLRGTENLFMDLAYGDILIFRLRDMLHEFNLKEISIWAGTDVDAVSFMDDWGTQKTLLISPEIWRAFYKPLYKQYCDILHSRNKFVFFHSDGNIEAIYPDLVEIGVDAINSQLFCMDIEKLGQEYSGRVTFWGEIDRQFILPFGTASEVRNAVKRVANALLKGKRTGLIAQCEWGVKDPRRNIEMVFEEWEKY